MDNQLLDAKFSKIQKQLAQAYLNSQTKVIAEAEDLYLQMLESGEISYGQMVRYDRLYKINAAINQELKRLGQQEINILDKGMNELYMEVLSKVNPGMPYLHNQAAVQEVINRVWCADGKLWSDRIWTSKTELQQTLQEVLVDSVIRGKSHKFLVAKLKERFGVADSDAERLARTELNYVQNQAAMRGYLDAGYEYYEFITSHDNRTCGECEDLDGQIFAFKDAVVGVNYPPIHPNCRSNIVGYKE